MEGLVMDRAFWQGRRVLVTGHTGFKGAWLAFWLAELGAKVFAVALPPDSDPDLCSLLELPKLITSRLFDINDREALAEFVSASRPEIVLHLAAQALVRHSYRQPIETFATNVLGVVTLLDVIRQAPSVVSVVIVTSDKCYENDELTTTFNETDRLGGRDPYSASKGCAEIATRSMQRSFFRPYRTDGHPARIATVRAGNVIGGGDWAEDRLVPDVIRGCLGRDEAVRLRNPNAVRPWQHVLEPLRGYLTIAKRLVTAPDGVDEAWNLGPDVDDARTVRDVAEAIIAALGVGRIVVDEDSTAPHEAGLLRLDCSKVKARLGLEPLLHFDDAIGLTAAWYSAWKRGLDVKTITRQQIADYTDHAMASLERQKVRIG